jgi:hypothetical protein
MELNVNGREIFFVSCVNSDITTAMISASVIFDIPVKWRLSSRKRLICSSCIPQNLSPDIQRGVLNFHKVFPMCSFVCFSS